MNPLEKLGLIKSVEPTQPAAMPDNGSPALDLTSIDTDGLPIVSMDTIRAETTVEEVYAQATFDPAVNVKRLTDFIATLPESLPETTKQTSVGGILKASGIDIQDLLNDGASRIDLITSAKQTAQNDHQQLCTEASEEIAKLEGYIEASKNRMLESQNRTSAMVAALDAELANLEGLMAFARGVVNASNPIQPNA